MSKHRIEGIPRKYSTHRISAYECMLDISNRPLKGKYVRGWYGLFNEKKLCNEVIPKLAEYAAQGWTYPFLITSHMLEKGTTAHITVPPGKQKAGFRDIKFRPRIPKPPQIWVAIVLSPTQYKLLTSE